MGIGIATIRGAGTHQQYGAAEGKVRDRKLAARAQPALGGL
jgi:hypothetical protein